MDVDQFTQQRRSTWQQLETLVQQATSKPRSLSASDVHELGRLYRIATADLALAQREFANRPITAYLNQLIGRSHVVIYRGEPILYRNLSAIIPRASTLHHNSIPPVYDCRAGCLWHCLVATFGNLYD